MCTPDHEVTMLRRRIRLNTEKRQKITLLANAGLCLEGIVDVPFYPNAIPWLRILSLMPTCNQTTSILQRVCYICEEPDG